MLTFVIVYACPLINPRDVLASNFLGSGLVEHPFIDFLRSAFSNVVNKSSGASFPSL